MSPAPDGFRSWQRRKGHRPTRTVEGREVLDLEAEKAADQERLRRHDCGPWGWAEHDARGIYLCRVCPECRTAKLSRYRPDVLSDPQYDPMGEQIEPDE